MSDDIDKKLAQLERLREELHHKLSETSAVLDAVAATIKSIDVGNSVDPSSSPNMTRRSKESQRLQLIPDGLTEDQITIRPGRSGGAAEHTKQIMYRETLEASPATVCLKDSHGKIHYANEALHRFYKLPVDSMIGTNDSDWNSALVVERNRRRDSEVLATKATQEYIEQVSDTAGTAFYWYTQAFPAEGKSGVFVAVVNLDVTELVIEVGEPRALPLARGRFEAMEMLKQQLLRLACELG